MARRADPGVRFRLQAPVRRSPRRRRRSPTIAALMIRTAAAAVERRRRSIELPRRSVGPVMASSDPLPAPTRVAVRRRRSVDPRMRRAGADHSKPDSYPRQVADLAAGPCRLRARRRAHDRRTGRRPRAAGAIWHGRVRSAPGSNATHTGSIEESPPTRQARPAVCREHAPRPSLTRPDPAPQRRWVLPPAVRRRNPSPPRPREVSW
jgi:hypothetical protein